MHFSSQSVPLLRKKKGKGTSGVANAFPPRGGRHIAHRQEPPHHRRLESTFLVETEKKHTARPSTSSGTEPALSAVRGEYVLDADGVRLAVLPENKGDAKQSRCQCPACSHLNAGQAMPALCDDMSNGGHKAPTVNS